MQPYELKRQRSVPIADNDRSSIHGILVKDASSTINIGAQCDTKTLQFGTQAVGSASQESSGSHRTKAASQEGGAGSHTAQALRTLSQEHYKSHARISRNASLDSALEWNNACSYRVPQNWSECSSSQGSASDRDSTSCEGEPQVFAHGGTSGGEVRGGDENVIGLERALQAVTALATAPVSRVTLYGGLRNMADSSADQQDTSQDNPQVDSAQNQGLSGDYLEQIRLYGTLLRMMGDQFSGDVNPRDFEDYEARVRMLSNRQNNQ